MTSPLYRTEINAAGVVNTETTVLDASDFFINASPTGVGEASARIFAHPFDNTGTGLPTYFMLLPSKLIAGYRPTMVEPEQQPSRSSPELPRR